MKEPGGVFQAFFLIEFSVNERGGGWLSEENGGGALECRRDWVMVGICVVGKNGSI